MQPASSGQVLKQIRKQIIKLNNVIDIIDHNRPTTADHSDSEMIAFGLHHGVVYDFPVRVVNREHKTFAISP